MRNTLFIFIAFTFACEPSKSEEIQALKTEVLGLHDEVMPKTNDLRRARKDLMLQADSLFEKDSARAQILMRASDDIAAANESMMNWMHNFELDFEGTEEEQLEYFQKKKASIEEVKSAINESLAKGKEVLN